MKLIMESWKKFVNELTPAATKFVQMSQDPDTPATQYIPLLKKIAADPEFKAIASAGRTDDEGPEDEKFEIKSGTVPASALHATQKEIGMSNSLADQMERPSWAKGGKSPAMAALGLAGEPIEMLCKDERCAILTFGPIGGKYRILDGHHRWSQVMMMNPNGKVAIDNVVPKGVLSNVGNALKVMQLAIALKAGQVVTIPFEGKNLMDASADEVKEYVRQNISPETVKLLMKKFPEGFPAPLAAGGEEPGLAEKLNPEGGVDIKQQQSKERMNPQLLDKIAEYIAGNLAALQSNRGFDEFTRAGVMPQAADAGTTQGAVNQALKSGAVNIEEPEPDDVKLGVVKR